MTKKWIKKKNDLPSCQYSINKNIRFKASVLRSDLCDYSDAYIFVKGRITVEGDNDDKIRNQKLIFKNNAPFRSSISKINNTFIDDGEDPDNAMPMYNLLEYCDNYSMTLGSLWNYYRDEVNYNAIESDNANNKINNDKRTPSKSFEYKIKIIRKRQLIIIHY